MSQDIRSSKSFGAGDRTIAALKFHTERVRQRGGETSVAHDHNQILGNMVDLHHRNMSMVRASLLKFGPMELRGSSTTIDMNVDADDFSSDSEEEEETTTTMADGSRVGGLNSSTSASDGAPDGVVGPAPTAKAGASRKSLAAAQAPEVDPVSFYRQMRAATMSRTASQHLPSSLKGAYAFLAPPQDEVTRDEEGSKVDLSSLRGKSFLSRPDQQGAAYDMLAQIRGPNWDSDNGAAVKSSKSLPVTTRPEGRPEGALGSGLGLATSSLPPAGMVKSVSSVAGKSPTALPRVSVDSTPSLPEIERLPGRHSLGGAGASSGGLFSRLKHMMKQ